MVNWVAVYKRILQLYAVTTQQELGMALGVPISFGLDGDMDTPIPWPILELVVSEKRISWDWLLTGRNDRGAGDPVERRSVPDTTESGRGTVVRTPRIETRELERVLLTPEEEAGEDGGDEGEADEQVEAAVPEDPVAAAAVRRLEELRAEMQREIAKVEHLLGKREQ